MMRWKLIGLGVLALLLSPVLLLALLSLVSRKPPNVGIESDRLPPCPATPNCVSSQAADPNHQIEPLPLNGPPKESFRLLAEAIANMPRATVVTQSPRYLHAEFRSRLFRFVDDLELLLDAPAGVIHVRSASRAGRSDLGVNRARVEEIRRQWRQLQNHPPPDQR